MQMLFSGWVFWKGDYLFFIFMFFALPSSLSKDTVTVQERLKGLAFRLRNRRWGDRRDTQPHSKLLFPYRDCQLRVGGQGAELACFLLPKSIEVMENTSGKICGADRSLMCIKSVLKWVPTRILSVQL